MKSPPTSLDVIPPFPVHSGGGFTTPLRVCFSLPEFLGFPNRGGIGEAYAAFAEALVKAGHDVTVLIAADDIPGDPRMDDVKNAAKTLGVNLVFLPRLSFRCATVPNSGPHSIIAYRAWHWLKDQNFDVIHFTEYLTSGFFCVSAKRAGLGFQKTLLCVSLRSPSRWCREGDDSLISEFATLETDFLEQRTSELADLVFVPSRHIAEWATSRGWQLPARLYHQANLIRLPSAVKKPALGPVTEIVFFGRLQPRKGLLEFCDAIDQLEPDLLSRVRITFLGSHVIDPIDSRAYLTKKSAAWRTSVHVLDQHSREAALEYLQKPGVLAVLPSRAETFGTAVYECQVLGIPFLASDATAIPELIRSTDRDSVLFQPSAKALAKKLAHALIEPPRPVPPRYLPSESEKLWVGWHNELGRATVSSKLAESPSDPLPRVSVCLVHYNQPLLVLKAIESLEAQTYPNFEVILVDDGSTHPLAPAALLEIEERFARRGWRVLRQENQYVGVARNHAAREATGEFLMFMDDDNIAKPEEIACFVRAALNSGQDVVVCVTDCFEGLDAPLPEGHHGHWRQLFLGGPLSAAIFQNTFGDANFFIRRSVFESLGGFANVRDVTGEDRYLLARAELAGHRILLLPEPLYHYRVRPDSMYRSLTHVGKEKLVLSVFDDVVPPPIADTLVYAFGLHKKITASGLKSSSLRDYRTVADASAAEIGVQGFWGSGWFEDEWDQIWSGGEAGSATILLNASSACFVDFCAHVVAAQPGNSLSVALNDEVKLSDFTHELLQLEDLSLRQGVNTLTFTPRFPPARTIPGEHRKLGYLFTRISLTPSASRKLEKVAEDIMTPVESADRTVLINELGKIGARAVFAKGWHDDEIVLRWSGRSGQHSSLVFHTPVEQNIHLQADIRWFDGGNALQTRFHGETVHVLDPGMPLKLPLTLKPDLDNTLDFEVLHPPASAGPHDPRCLSFCLSNIQITLMP